MATEEVPGFEKKIFKMLHAIDDKKYLLQAIEMTIPIYEKMNRCETVGYLKKVLGDLK